MSDDLLKQYTSAFKEEYEDGSTAFPEATRARVIRSLAERRPRRAKWWAIGIPALALFAGSTAFAAASGRLDAIVQRAGVVLGIVAEHQPGAPVAATKLGKRRGPTSASSQHATAAASLAASAPIAEPPAAMPALSPSEPLPESGIAQQSPLNSSASQAAPLSDPQLQLRHQEEAAALAAYQQAHTAHFGRGDCAAALAAYASYLAHYPRGRFVMEAKYNRALCLLKTGQLPEGRAALLPFAEGTFGNYRQTQARALLDALQSNASAEHPEAGLDADATPIE